MMQYIGRRYVPYINHTYGPSRSIWGGRFKASLVGDEQYLLTCMRYMELNPVRANMVKVSSYYRWSSYRYNALGKQAGKGRPNGFLKEPPLALMVGAAGLAEPSGGLLRRANSTIYTS